MEASQRNKPIPCNMAEASYLTIPHTTPNPKTFLLPTHQSSWSRLVIILSGTDSSKVSSVHSSPLNHTVWHPASLAGRMSFLKLSPTTSVSPGYMPKASTPSVKMTGLGLRTPTTADSTMRPKMPSS